MLGDVILVGKKGPDAPELQDALAAVQDRQLVDAHKLLAELLIVEGMGHLAAPALAGVVGIHGFFPQGCGKLPFKCFTSFREQTIIHLK